ncbi:MAG: LPS export ABC transporter periplasmic protein LptC [Rubrivivax sp.]
MSVELHLPDLPEVPISLGPAAPRTVRRPPWGLRLRETLAAYLPLLLMLALALAAWWLVKNTPLPAAPSAERAPGGEPDYEMQHFALERFDASGRLVLRIEGERLQHDPAHDRVRIDKARIRAVAADGRVTLAHAEHALGNGDGSELQLQGGAEVSSTDAEGAPLRMTSEFLHLFLVRERVRTHLPVTVRIGSSQIAAAGLSYDHAQRRLELAGPMRGVFVPAGRSR